MKIELSEQDVANTIVVLEKADIKGADAFAMAMLIQTFKVALRPTKDDTPEEQDKPAENGVKPKEAKARK